MLSKACIDPQNSSWKTETRCLLNCNSSFSPALRPWVPPFCFFSLLTPLGTSHEWNQTLFAFLWPLTSVSLTSSTFIHDTACVRISFLFKVVQYPVMCIYHTVSIHPSVDTWIVSTFSLLWMMLLWTWCSSRPCFQFFGSKPRSGIPGSYGNSLLRFLKTAILFSAMATRSQEYQFHNGQALFFCFFCSKLWAEASKCGIQYGYAATWALLQRTSL